MPAKTKKDLESENAILRYWLEEVIYYIENGRFTLLELCKIVKALEIIKNKVQKIKWLGFKFEDGADIYSIDYRETPTTEEDDLLREVLK